MFGRKKPRGPFTVLASTTVTHGSNEAFRAWQVRMTQIASTYPGFQGSKTRPPDPPEQPDWITTFIFDTRENLTVWLKSDDREVLQAEAAMFRTTDERLDVFEGARPDTRTGRVVTSILYWDVRPHQEHNFRKWHVRYAQAMSESPGFQGYQLQEPIDDLQPQWVQVIRWDSVVSRDGWIRSDTRKRMLELGQRVFETYRARQVRTSFEGWFRFDSTTAGSPTPSWKQTMVVLLVLYPTVFLLNTYVVSEIVGDDAEMWLSLFVGNVLSVALMGFIIMPIVTGDILGWWLNPPPTATSARTWAGVAVVLAVYGLFLGLFSVWP